MAELKSGDTDGGNADSLSADDGRHGSMKPLDGTRNWPTQLVQQR
jgi:hypothetical protein